MTPSDFDYRLWKSPAPRAVFLLVHGLGAHGQRWEALGKYFRDKNITSYAIELGNSQTTPSSRGREYFSAYYGKIANLYDVIKADNPGKKIFLVGESMGGLISFLLAAAHPGIFHGLICISPSFDNRYKPPLFEIIKMLLPIFYNPEKEFDLPFDPSMCTRDPYYRNILEEEFPSRHTVSSRLIFDILSAETRAKIIKNKMKMPVLFLLAGDDKIVDPAASRKILDSLGAPDKTLLEFPGMYHSLSIELDREEVFEKMLKWVLTRLDLREAPQI